MATHRSGLLGLGLTLSLLACGVQTPRAALSPSPPLAAPSPPARVLDTESVCAAGELDTTIERLCASPRGPDVLLCERVGAGPFQEIGDAAHAAGRPRLLLALASRWLRAGRSFGEADLHPVVMATHDAAVDGLCVAGVRSELARLHGSRCQVGVGVLRRPERGAWCAALLDATCSLWSREADAVRQSDPGRAGELFRELSYGSHRRCSPTADRVWEYGARARRAFDAARRFQDAQRVDETLAEHPRPIREVPHAPRWQGWHHRGR